MSHKYYETTDVIAVAAVTKFQKDSEELCANLRAWADSWGGTSVLDNSTSGVRLAGFRLDKPDTNNQWSRVVKGTQRPLTVTNKRVTDKVAQKELLAKWDAEYPNDKNVSRHAMWTALGTDWGTLMFHGIAVFALNDVVYIKTSAPLADHCKEITNIEWDKHQAVYTQTKK